MENKFDLAKFDKVMADVTAVAELGNFIPDMSTKEGYNASKRFVLDNTTPMRKALEAAHKDIKAPFWDACKFLDSKKKELMTMIEAVEEPHKLAYKNHDAEIKRKKEEAARAIQSRFDELDSALAFCAGFESTSEQISNTLEDIQNYDVCPDFFGERIDSYVEKLNSTIAQLTGFLTQKIQLEQMQKQQAENEAKMRALEEAEAERRAAELEKQQREALEQQRKEFEAKQAQMKLEQEEAERKHAEEMKALAEKAEAERIAAEKAEIERQKQVEAERLAKEEAERKSRTENRNKAAKQLMEVGGISKEQAVLICNAIAAGDVLFITSSF